LTTHEELEREERGKVDQKKRRRDRRDSKRNRDQKGFELAAPREPILLEQRAHDTGNRIWREKVSSLGHAGAARSGGKGGELELSIQKKKTAEKKLSLGVLLAQGKTSSYKKGDNPTTKEKDRRGGKEESLTGAADRYAKRGRGSSLWSSW